MFLQGADAVDAVDRSRVDFNDVHGRALVDLLAKVASVTGFGILQVAAIEGLGEDAGGGGFTHSPGTREDISMGHAVGLDGVLKGPCNVFLAHHVGESLGAPLEGHDLRGHQYSKF